MKQRLAAWAPALVGVATVVGLFGHLLWPGQVLVGRDVPFLHLPLRLDFQRLVADGMPAWNPWIHGGQPILSNPHYAPWYPTTWLVVLLPVHRAWQLAIALHGLLAFFGAHRLARHLGCGFQGSILAAVAFAAGGPLVSLATLTLMFFGFAWLPWILLWGDRALLATNRADATRAVLGGGVAWALQILNGDPTAVAFTGAVLGLLAASACFKSVGARLLPWRRLAALAGLALVLGSVQIVPTWFRLRDSARGGGLSLDRAAVWSARPERMVELVAPHFFGDATRDEEDLYFGWSLHDKGYPFLLSIAPGLLVLVLGVAAIPSPGTHRRGVWLGAVAIGVFFGLGRHNPLFPLLHASLPLLSMVRYPEKFLLLPLLSLPFAAGLGWRQLVESREQSRDWLFPRALAGGFALLLALLAVAVWWPQSGEALVRAQSGAPPTAKMLAAGANFLRGEALVAVVNSGLLLALLLLPRRWAVSGRAFFAAGLLLVVADIAYYGRGFLPVFAESKFFMTPNVVRGLAPGERIFTDLAFHREPAGGPRLGEPGTYQVRGRLDWVDPYTGNFWGLGHILHEDFDLMLTSWARYSLAILHQDWADPELVRRLLGAWNVGTLLHARSTRELLPELRAGKIPELSVRENNPAVLPRWRSVPEAVFYADASAALAAARRDRYDLAAREQLIGAPPEVVARAAIAAGVVLGSAHFAVVKILAAREGGREISLRLEPGGASLLVAAVTFDGGWTARTADGTELPLWPTALGQIAVAVPAGADAVVFRYSDPWVGVGAALSVIGLLAVALVWRRNRSPTNA